MRSVAAAVFVVVLAACGEPAVDVTLPERSDAGHVADLAEVLEPEQRSELEGRLGEIATDGPDIVALTYTTEQANCGEAYRAARRFVEEWEADIALVAVAEPGDFTSTSADRRRCLGVQPRDDRAVPGDLRERIAETLVPPKAADNDWFGAFSVAAEALANS